MFGNLGKMMKIAAELKTKLPEMQQKLAETQYTAEGGGGAVSATVTGKMALVAVKFDRSRLCEQSCDAAMEALAAATVEAVNAAQAKAAAAAKEALMELTGGMEIPGLTDNL